MFYDRFCNLCPELLMIVVCFMKDFVIDDCIFTYLYPGVCNSLFCDYLSLQGMSSSSLVYVLVWVHEPVLVLEYLICLGFLFSGPPLTQWLISLVSGLLNPIIATPKHGGFTITTSTSLILFLYYPAILKVLPISLWIIVAFKKCMCVSILSVT